MIRERASQSKSASLSVLDLSALKDKARVFDLFFVIISISHKQSKTNYEFIPLTSADCKATARCLRATELNWLPSKKTLKTQRKEPNKSQIGASGDLFFNYNEHRQRSSLLVARQTSKAGRPRPPACSAMCARSHRPEKMLLRSCFKINWSITQWCGCFMCF